MSAYLYKIYFIEQKKPKIWKMLLLTWLVIYPLINILFAVLMPHILHLHNMVKTLIMTLVLVPTMGIILGKLQVRFND